MTRWETGHRGGMAVYFYEDGTFPSPAGRRFMVSGATDEQLDLIEAAPDLLDALKIVCNALADYRDGENVNLEELKYCVVDRIIEAVEPGFDGGTTSLDEYRMLAADFRAGSKGETK